MAFFRRASAMKILPLLLLLLVPAAWAETPPPPPVEDPDQTIEPEVTIREERDRTVHEYRVNGRIYMVKIVPRKGPPYYLLDLDGDGELDTREEDPAAVVVPQWILFRW